MYMYNVHVHVPVPSKCVNWFQVNPVMTPARMEQNTDMMTYHILYMYIICTCTCNLQRCMGTATIMLEV